MYCGKPQDTHGKKGAVHCGKPQGVHSRARCQAHAVALA